MPVTLSLYVARAFTLSMLGMTTGLAGLVSLFDFIELLRRAAARPEASLSLVVQIAALRLPWIATEILPFAVLIGGILAFWRLTRSSELVVARAAGISAWQFLSAPVFCAIVAGVVATAVVSPMSAAMRARAEALDTTYLRSGGGGPLSLSGGQLWLRQADRGFEPHGVAILHAGAVTLNGEALLAREVSVFRLSDADQLLERIEASSARLADGAWLLANARTLTPGQLPRPAGELRLGTDLTVARVQESFASPDTLSFWALPSFIRLLQRSGFSAIRHRLYFQELLALPLLAGTMCLLAAAFSMRSTRRGGVAKMIASGVAAGFALFMVTKVAAEFGQSGALPVTLAAWAPTAAGLLLSLSLLLHLEDG